MDRTPLCLVAGVLLLPGCPLLDVQADVAETCVTYPGVKVDAQPPATLSVDKSFTIDHLDSFKALADQGFHLAFVRGEVRATSGVADFSFVDKAAVEVASGDPSSTLPTLEVFDCDHCATDSAKLDVTTTTQGDAAPYVETGSLVLTVDLAGQAPTVAWTMDVDVCMTGSASYQLNP